MGVSSQSQRRWERLPLWAKALLEQQQRDIRQLEAALVTLNEAHAVLVGKEWFTIPGDKEQDEVPRKLFFLSRDGALPVCSLFQEDTLLIGRNRREGGI